MEEVKQIFLFKKIDYNYYHKLDSVYFICKKK